MNAVQIGAPPPATARQPRHDGEGSRARLLQSGLRLFAQQGYTKTSTRELAEDAGVNVAAISYYFGDKAGLYRALFTEPPGMPRAADADFDAPGLALEASLARFFAVFVEPLRQGDSARLCMKLHFREMLEPTGLWADDAAAGGIRPLHEALLRVLTRHLGLAAADDEVRRLAVSIIGLGVHLHVGRDVIAALAPALDASPDAIDRWSDRLVMYARAMIDAEARRRARQPVPSGENR